jgi:hypothetical protein
MTGQLAILVSFIIFLAFFGWLGWRRGARREIIVFIVAAAAWVLLQQQGSVFVNIANLASAAVVFARAGGFTGSPEDAFAAISDAPQLITEETRFSYLFVLWLLVFVVTYVLTTMTVADARSPHNGWAILFGILNGLFFGVAFLPSLNAIFAPDGGTPATEGGALNLITLLGNGLRVLWEGLAELWGVVEATGKLGLLVLLTLLLVLAASTIRGGAKAKS